MLALGIEYLGPVIAGERHDAKLVFNERGVIVLPGDLQHREFKAEDISYEDNYIGNALAAMIRRDAIEIRYHKSFSDRDVTRIIAPVLALDAFEPWRTSRVTYQGREIKA